MPSFQVLVLQCNLHSLSWEFKALPPWWV